jgi:cysteinyl-tRNA synthetase
VQTARPMGLTIENTLTGAKETFTPSEPGHARIYVCGPTVYDYSHLGHARCYVIYDVLVRHLRTSGMRVTFVRNYTDVDDKILKRAAERGIGPRELATEFEHAFREDMARLGNLEPDLSPKVTDHIPEVIELIEKLIARGHAYPSEGDVYFSVESFPSYGKLSHRDLAQMKAGASERLDEDKAQRKRHSADFVLWKGGEHEGVTWDSPFGRGRPGWHIECSAMAMTHLGETFDLHGGGLDLVFPHHENEIAQSEAATGAPYATCWMHNGFVEVDSEKMAKSKGNFFTARELFERIEPEAVRLFVMTVHYRAPLNLDFRLDEDGKPIAFPQLEEAERRLEYLYKTKERLLALPCARVVSAADAEIPPAIANLARGVGKALDDDLNMPVALASIAEYLSAVNELCDVAMRKKGTASKETYEAAVRGLAAIEAELGLGADDAAALLTRIRDRRASSRGITPGFVDDKIRERTEARARKDFAAADAVRDELAALGVELHDSPDGTRWSML